MKFSAIRPQSLLQQKCDCIILGVYDKGKFTHSGDVVDKASKGQLSSLIKSGDVSWELGKTTLLHQVQGISIPRVVLVGLGKKPLTPHQYHRVVRASLQTLLTTPSKTCLQTLPEVTVESQNTFWTVRQTVILSEEATYQYGETKSKKPEKYALQSILFPVEDKQLKTALLQGQAIGTGMNTCRALANLPSNRCTPTYLAQQALAIAKKYPSLRSHSLDEAAMKKLGMGSLLSVSKGSHQPAKLIIIEYKGSKKASQSPYVLVGKGITFDTGGISLKPRTNMDEMKFDMCGAASVMGTLQAVAELKLPINVVGIVAASENMPGGGASKPGDIVTSMSGKTIEILDTDAEGRLVLCDALTYAARYKPKVVLDMATLTGAIVVALGQEITGLFSNDDALAENLLKAAHRSEDCAWRLPLWRSYDSQLKSNFADLANIGTGGAGSIIAACFLAQFTEEYRWAHLDIAGTAYLSGSQKGATGRPVPLLTQYLIDECS